VTATAVQTYLSSMGAIRVATLSALVVWQFGLSTGAAAPPLGQEDLSRTLRDESRFDDEADRLPPVGLQLDAGLPDGVILALAIRPIPYTRLHLGAGSNTSSPGLRGGLSILPVGEGPSFNFEVGHYLAGQTNALVRSLFAGMGDFGSFVRRFSYTFVNAHAGLELGRRNVTFFIHGGFTYLRATLRDLDVPTQTEAMRPGRTTVTFTKDPLLKMLAPSAKLGLVVYLH
jgi:hypothetical protein